MVDDTKKMPRHMKDIPRAARSLTLSILVLIALTCLYGQPCNGQTESYTPQPKYGTLLTDSVGPQRFLAVHGRRANIQGFATHGLEVWAYPLQLVDDYRVGFRKTGSTTELDGTMLLRTVSYEPEAVVRTFVGPDFVVKERLFVPLNAPAAIITYTVDSKDSIDVIAHFAPVLNLSWPGSIGGQAVDWRQSASAYILFEPSRQFSALVGSPDIIAHDGTVNTAAPDSNQKHFSFVMSPTGEPHRRRATVVVSLLDNTTTDAATTIGTLLASRDSLENEARTHYETLTSNNLEIITPDDAVNEALSRAEIALDQTWVCNPYLGCASIAGYGPSRDARRPQYEWFFAGDGLITVDAMLAAGEYGLAKDELQFIIKYQDKKNGMVWHELSQSASFIDWANKYPYMFVHVDITFQYLEAASQYVLTTGDKKFVTDNWLSLQSAYDYCKSLIDTGDGLPRIPNNKEGGNEQDRLTDELALSVSWYNAAQSFSNLAAIAGHEAEATEAKAFSERAPASIVKRYWVSDTHQWIDSYTTAGKPVFGKGAGGISLIKNHILDTAQNDLVLHQIASSDFQTDWGTRSIAASSPDFDANSYGKGSVWALQTAGVASTYWSEHWPATAFPIWKSLIQWNSLDSLGHIHEVLAGDFYHQQTESVPEQTWSSAAMFSSAVRGLLGLEIDATANRVTFAPHLPMEWKSLRVNRVKLGQGDMDVSLTRSVGNIQIAIENRGEPFGLRFAPEIPFGAQLGRATMNERVISAKQENHDQDSHAVVDLTIPHGRTTCTIQYRGGVLLSVPSHTLLPGDASSGVKITGVKYKGATLLIDADFAGSYGGSILLETTDKIQHVTGATLRSTSDGVTSLDIAPGPAGQQNTTGYAHIEIAVEFANPGSKR
jgi:glycogen debranching enzyme